MRQKIIIFFFILGVSPLLHGQGESIYDLLTEPSLDRPLTVHKGFLQLNAGYTHLNGNTYFDETGAKLPFTESVRSMIENNFRFDITYGILEHIEFHAGITHKNRFETWPTYLIDNHSNIGYEDKSYHTKGLTNLAIDLKYRLPTFLDGFDMFVYAGLVAPVSSQHTRIPSHSITLGNAADPGGAYVLQYEFNPAAGTPALFYSGGLKILYALEKIGVSININARMPFSEVETYNWASRLYGDQFEYYQIPFTLRPKGIIFGGTHLEVQTLPWFAVNAGYDHYMETAGWSNETGQSVSLTRSSAGFLSAGFEIQVSTHLRLLQQVNIPVYGKSIYSEFNIHLGIAYSLVPLENLYY